MKLKDKHTVVQKNLRFTLKFFDNMHLHKIFEDLWHIWFYIFCAKIQLPFSFIFHQLLEVLLYFSLDSGDGAYGRVVWKASQLSSKGWIKAEQRWVVSYRNTHWAEAESHPQGHRLLCVTAPENNGMAVRELSMSSPVGGTAAFENAGLQATSVLCNNDMLWVFPCKWSI